MAFEFDRYVNGQLMAEGVIIERQNNLPDAMREAARIASRGPNGEAPVLVLRAESLSRTGAVKALDEGDFEEIINAAAVSLRKASSGVRGQTITVYDGLDWWIMKETERRILSALSVKPVATIEQVLDAFDAETKTVPLGHENRQRGASTYNWRRSIADEIRSLAAAMIAASKEAQE